MPDQVPTIIPHPQAEAAPGDTMRPPGPGASESRRAEEQGRVGTPLDGAPRKWPRRRIARWVANLMIIGGVCLLTYPLGTWGYTWYEQRHLRQELVQSNPGLAAAEAALAAGDLIRATPPSTTVTDTGMSAAHGAWSLLPRTTLTGAIAASRARMSGPPMSPPWTM